MKPIFRFLVLFVLSFGYYSCADTSRNNSNGENESGFSSVDTTAIMEAIFQYDDFSEYDRENGYSSLSQMISEYPLDTVLLIKNDFLSTDKIPVPTGKILKVIDIPKGYADNGYIPIYVDLHIGGFETRRDTASCRINMAVFTSLFDYELKKIDGSWQVTYFNLGRF